MPPHPRPCMGDVLRISLFPNHRAILAVALLVYLCLPNALHASEHRKFLPLLRTCRSVHHLVVADANQHFPVRLRAVVSFYEAGSKKYGPSLFVTDRSGSVFVALIAAPAVPLVAGDLVEITGVSSGGDYAPVVAEAKTHVLGRSVLPSTAPRVGMESLMSGRLEGQRVEVEGVIHSEYRSEGEVTLDLTMRDGGMILARTPFISGIDYSHLVDNAVIITGNAAPTFNHRSQITGSKILFSGAAALRVEHPAPADPFLLPVQRPETLMQYAPDKELWHRVHLRGAVTLYWPARLICIEDHDEAVCAQIEQSTPVNTGDSVDVVGFPAVDEFTPTLSHAIFKLAAPRLAIPHQDITSSQALSGRYDKRLVAIEAVLIGKDRTANDPTVVLSSGAFVFTGVMPKASAGDRVETLELGSRVRLTGICSVQADSSISSDGSGFLVAKSFRLLLRSPADIEVLNRPSWWNASHTLRVLSLALFFALVALCKVVLLSRRLARQREVIRTQLLQTAMLKDQAESASLAAKFHAAHDELTGTFNRRTIFAALNKAFDDIAKSGTSIGVVMIDLDHFKRVNDSYGHLAGDEILRETVRRINSVIRSSDVVGRYGGEEFIIILQRCDKSHLQACAEGIRTAIADTPMLIGNIKISMTTSVGTVVAMSPPHPMLDTLAAADSALYRAKHEGRNRVILKDLATGKFEEYLAPSLMGPS